ncbi:MAG: hypothetical protein R3E87_03775 [Burkholderiaceae bacterium]
MQLIRPALIFSVLLATAGPAFAATADAVGIDNARVEQEMARRLPPGLAYGQSFHKQPDASDDASNDGDDRTQRKPRER